MPRHLPNLSYPVVTALDRGGLDALYEAQKRHAPGQLGDNATKEFVLRHVLKSSPSWSNSRQLEEKFAGDMYGDNSLCSSR